MVAKALWSWAMSGTDKEDKPGKAKEDTGKRHVKDRGNAKGSGHGKGHAKGRGSDYDHGKGYAKGYDHGKGPMHGYAKAHDYYGKGHQWWGGPMRAYDYAWGPYQHGPWYGNDTGYGSSKGLAMWGQETGVALMPVETRGQRQAT